MEEGTKRCYGESGTTSVTESDIVPALAASVNRRTRLPSTGPIARCLFAHSCVSFVVMYCAANKRTRYRRFIKGALADNE